MTPALGKTIKNASGKKNRVWNLASKKALVKTSASRSSQG